MSVAHELVQEPPAPLARAARRPRVAYFHRAMTEFIRIDLELIAERHALAVEECATRWPRPLRVLRRVLTHDVAMSWFASWHSFWPVLAARLLGRRSVVVIGGYDTARLPEIQYGHGPRFHRWVARATMRMATVLVAPSEFARDEAATLGIDPSRIEVIPLGLDPAAYPPSGVMRGGTVITVGGVNRSNLLRKGIEPFVRAAALRPDLEFVVVGGWGDDAIDHLRAIATPNVRFTGHVSHEDKVRWYQRSRVVVQASKHEAFGLSLVEGMLCGCVPVVTAAGSLPEVTGGCGVIVQNASPAAIAAGIGDALDQGLAAGLAARRHVLWNFTLDERRRRLEALLERICRDRAASASESETANR